MTAAPIPSDESRADAKVFSLTEKQREALATVAGTATHAMLFGGSRSGKTFLHVRNLVMRAMKAPGSRHCILRFRFNHIKSSIIFDTFPKVMQKAFPNVEWKLNKSDWYVTLENGSEVWFGGLDDKERTEKILGNEYVTILLNECSQISWQARNIVVTRLAQKVMSIVKGMPPVEMKPRMWYDCNPPPKSHWTYLLFVRKVDPDTKELLPNPENYVSMKMNPKDNLDNLNADYLSTLDSLSARLRKRFRDGEFADANPSALFLDETIEKWRVIDRALPDFVRIVIGVDPSGSDDADNAGNDEIGIIIAALGIDGICYIMEDCTVKAGPATWGKVATGAFDRYGADLIVGEVNYGGAMVKHVIQSCRAKTPFLAVTASRGKAVRAEPISVLYEEGKVRHVGNLRELEDELAEFSTVGYVGEGSPNRADAMVWAVTALFPALTKPPEAKKAAPLPTVNHFRTRS